MEANLEVRFKWENKTGFVTRESRLQNKSKTRVNISSLSTNYGSVWANPKKQIYITFFVGPTCNAKNAFGSEDVLRLTRALVSSGGSPDHAPLR